MARLPKVSGGREELEALLVWFGRLFVRAEPRAQAGRYLEGLLGPIERKNGWPLAEHLGEARPWRTQRVLSHVLWDAEAACDLCRDHVVERLALGRNPPPPAFVLAWSFWRRTHQAVARAYHWGQRLTAEQPQL
jgi:hypothetical protein